MGWSVVGFLTVSRGVDRPSPMRGITEGLPGRFSMGWRLANPAIGRGFGHSAAGLLRRFLPTGGRLDSVGTHPARANPVRASRVAA